MTAARKAPARKAVAKPAAAKALEAMAQANAAQREAEGPDTVIVEWGGLEFEVIRDVDDWDFFSTIAPISQGNIAQGLVGILGADQVTELRKAHPGFTARQARELYETINATLGFGTAGN